MSPRDRLKKEVIDEYGGQCSCCAEAELEFLTIEHGYGDGAAHRQVAGDVYGDLKSRGYPRHWGIAVLCWNCNQATRYGRVCPHKRSKDWSPPPPAVNLSAPPSPSHALLESIQVALDAEAAAAGLDRFRLLSVYRRLGPRWVPRLRIRRLGHLLRCPPFSRRVYQAGGVSWVENVLEEASAHTPPDTASSS